MSFNIARGLTQLVSQTTRQLVQPKNQNINKFQAVFARYASTTPPKSVKEQIDAFVKKDDVVIFMKGTPNSPSCGFSRAVVQILNMHGVKYDAYNVLEDDDLRSGIKEYSNWPTVPQIYFKGEFIGGCDILLDMHRTGELVKELEKIGFKSKLADAEPSNEEK